MLPNLSLNLTVFHLNKCFAIHHEHKYIVPVMNLVHGLPSASHQRSLFHYIDFHATQTVPHHPGLHFPSSLHWVHTAVTNLSLTWKLLHPLYNTHSDRSQTSEYCSAFITLLVLAALPSHSVFLFSLLYCSAFITLLVIAALRSLVSSSS